MKQVIPDNQYVPPAALMRASDVNDEKVYVCVNKDKTCSSTLFVVRQEKEGWIFRDYTNGRYGMSGHFSTLQKAIDRAFTFGDVLEFNSYKEAFEFLSKK